ncbi:hypothetical protein C8Q80DRAFT_853364 [Daedaleopsis nitida]|nr:hypothetical protein C8Q80DRAFT_853364 [Daedaleopsis nitida]
MPSRDAIPAIRSIKDSVEQSHWRDWLGSTSQSKRHRVDRYLHGALRVMNILGDDVSSRDRRQFDRLYHRVASLPPSWPDERLNVAEDMWKLVMNIAEGIYPYLSPPAKSKEYYDFFYPTPQSPPRRRSVHFEETPQVYTHPTQYIYPAAAVINTGWWWPSSWPSAWYVPSMVPTLYSGWNMMYTPVRCAAGPQVW